MACDEVPVQSHIFTSSKRVLVVVVHKAGFSSFPGEAASSIFLITSPAKGRAWSHQGAPRNSHDFLSGSGEGSPPELTVSLRKKARLRYGENPHQSAAFYTDESIGDASLGGIATAVQHHGKEVRPQVLQLHVHCQATTISSFEMSMHSSRGAEHIPGHSQNDMDRSFA